MSDKTAVGSSGVPFRRSAKPEGTHPQGGPGFFRDDTDRNNFPDLIGAAGKETKPDGGGLCLLKVDIQAD